MGAVDPSISENEIVCEWLTSKDAARYLGTTPNAIRILVCRGKLKSYKLGTALRFRISDLTLLPKPNR